jgi:hypothetical protein
MIDRRRGLSYTRKTMYQMQIWRKSMFFKKILLLSIIVLGIFSFIGCSDDSGGDEPVAGTFLRVEQTGGASGTADSTGLELTFSVDPTTLTADHITVTGAAKGALSGTDITRTLAISDISVANGATVSVAIANPAGFLLDQSMQTALVYKAVIGTPYQGGKIAYIFKPEDPGYVSGETHGLIAANEDQSAGIAWISGGATQTTLNGGTSWDLGTGQANTIAMMGQTGFSGGAAKVCNDYTNPDTGTGVYSDWYLPSHTELGKLYANRTAIGGFTSGYDYWSSSESDFGAAQYRVFGSSYHFGGDPKSTSKRVRAVRSF